MRAKAKYSQTYTATESAVRSPKAAGSVLARAGEASFRFLKEECANREGAEAAELALKAHALLSDRTLLAHVTHGEEAIQEIAEVVSLTEAPEDAVCSLVMDLLSYCEREKIDWAEDVLYRAQERLQISRPRPSPLDT